MKKQVAVFLCPKTDDSGIDYNEITKKNNDLLQKGMSFMSALVMILLVWIFAKLVCPGFTLGWLLGWIFGNLVRFSGLILVILAVLVLIN